MKQRGDEAERHTHSFNIAGYINYPAPAYVQRKEDIVNAVLNYFNFLCILSHLIIRQFLNEEIFLNTSPKTNQGIYSQSNQEWSI